MGSDRKIDASRWFTTNLKVRYQENDSMGVVYHANYLNWFEVGRTEMIREQGLTYRSMEQEGLLLPLVDLQMKFIQPARYDDLIMVFTRLTKLSALRANYEYEIRRIQDDESKAMRSKWDCDDELPGELLVTGATNHVWVGVDWKPLRLDKSFPKLYNALIEAFNK